MWLLFSDKNCSFQPPVLFMFAYYNVKLINFICLRITDSFKKGNCHWRRLSKFQCHVKQNVLEKKKFLTTLQTSFTLIASFLSSPIKWTMLDGQVIALHTSSDGQVFATFFFRIHFFSFFLSCFILE